jgi:hypothetical protein
MLYVERRTPQVMYYVIQAMYYVIYSAGYGMQGKTTFDLHDPAVAGLRLRQLADPQPAQHV